MDLNFAIPRTMLQVELYTLLLEAAKLRNRASMAEQSSPGNDLSPRFNAAADALEECALEVGDAIGITGLAETPFAGLSARLALLQRERERARDNTKRAQA